MLAVRILVTGGAGYVGSHVVRCLQEKGHDPIVYDNLSTGHAEAVAGVELIVGDVADKERVTQLLTERQFDGAVHLAADSQVGESMRNPSKYFSNNVVGGLSLFDSLVAAGVPWVVLSSTAAVYGDPERTPIDETHPQNPTNPYGETKRTLERILDWYNVAYGLRSAALRYFNAAGAQPDGSIGEDHQPESHLLPIILQVALGQRAELSVFGDDYATPDGTAVRDYVHVCDLADAHVRVMEALAAGARSSAYNLGSQNGYSVLEVLNTVRQVTGKDISHRVDARRPGDPPVLIAKSDKARDGLGWTPRFGLKEIVETAWGWHSSHPSGFR